MRLSTIVDRLAMECDLQKCTVAQYRLAISRFSAWTGQPATPRDLSADRVNGFLSDLQQRFSPITVRNYRVAITRIWNYCTEAYGIKPYDPRRLRRPKIVRKPVAAWGPGQVCLLLSAAAKVQGFTKAGTPYSDILTAWILLGYDTGLRPIDLRSLRWSDVSIDDRIISITQHKTGMPHVAVLGDGSASALKKLPKSSLCVFQVGKPGIRRMELKLYEEAAKLGFKRESGQGLGTLRKCHATAIYRQYGETAAAESLGHVGGTRTVRASYIDSRAVQQGRLPLPPSIAS